jgi:hypothetical protein
METKKPSNPRMHNPDGMYASEARSEDCVTLRDHFAGLAMQAMINNPNIKRPDERKSDFIIFSKRAYQYADAMIEFRSENES